MATTTGEVPEDPRDPGRPPPPSTRPARAAMAGMPGRFGESPRRQKELRHEAATESCDPSSLLGLFRRVSAFPVLAERAAALSLASELREPLAARDTDKKTPG